VRRKKGKTPSIERLLLHGNREEERDNNREKRERKGSSWRRESFSDAGPVRTSENGPKGKNQY